MKTVRGASIGLFLLLSAAGALAAPPGSAPPAGGVPMEGKLVLSKKSVDQWLTVMNDVFSNAALVAKIDARKKQEEMTGKVTPDERQRLREGRLWFDLARKEPDLQKVFDKAGISAGDFDHVFWAVTLAGASAEMKKQGKGGPIKGVPAQNIALVEPRLEEVKKVLAKMEQLSSGKE